MKIKTIIAALMVSAAAFCLGAEEVDFMNEQENARILNVMAKIRRGETVTIAALGGSITTGYNSNPKEQNCWATLVGNWWKEKGKQYGANVRFMNEGVSGTDSAFAAARLYDHILKNNVDLVHLEFAMNDQWLEKQVRNRSYEGLIRRMEDNSPRAILALFVNERNDPQSSQQAEQQPICEYYHIPYVSWKDCEKKAHGSKLDWNNYFDGQEAIHPNNAGHAAIASHIIAKLESIWASLPADDSQLPPVALNLPKPKTDAGYQYVTYYNSTNLESISNTGWKSTSPVHSEWVAHGGARQGWSTTKELAEIVFKVKGTSVNVLYCESDGFRDAEAWVETSDGSAPKKIKLQCMNPIRNGYLGWASREIANTGDVETEFTVHIVCVKRRAADQGKETNILGLLVTHNEAVDEAE